MESDNIKLVNFEYYCPKCEAYSKSESEEPCCLCMSSPVLLYSHKPTLFREKERR